jgi:hypothetical protein
MVIVCTTLQAAYMRGSVILTAAMHISGKLEAAIGCHSR